MRITLILGGEGSAFAHDLAGQLGADDILTVIAPTVRGHFSAGGLFANPDLDSLLTSGTPTYSIANSLESIAYEPRWQRASDQVAAVRLVRTDLIRNGATLTDATIAATSRAALPYRLLPMCDDRAEFRVVVGSDDPRAIHVDEYLDGPAAHEAAQLLLIAEGISVSGSVSQALHDHAVLILGPSSRTLVIDPVLRTPGFLDLIGDALPVLVVDHEETAPAALVTVAGMSQPDPGRAESVPADPAAVLSRARELA